MDFRVLHRIACQRKAKRFRIYAQNGNKDFGLFFQKKIFDKKRIAKQKKTCYDEREKANVFVETFGLRDFTKTMPRFAKVGGDSYE